MRHLLPMVDGSPSILESLEGALSSLEESEKSMLETSPSMLKAFLIEQSEVLETSIEDLEQAYLRLSSRAAKEVEVLVNLDSAPLPSKSPLSDYEKSVEEKEWYRQEVLKPLAIAHLRRRRMQTENLSYEDVASWEPTEEYLNEAMQWVEPPSDFKPKKRLVRTTATRPEAERQGILVKEITTLVNKAQGRGITKTEILRSLGKDTSRWRTSCEEVLKYMLANRRIVRDHGQRKGIRYYLPIYAEHLREQEFHRQVFESLRTGPRTRTAIVKTTCYSNPKGHAKVKSALALLEREGLIRSIGNKWEMVV